MIAGWPTNRSSRPRRPTDTRAARVPSFRTCSVGRRLCRRSRRDGVRESVGGTAAGDRGADASLSQRRNEGKPRGARRAGASLATKTATGHMFRDRTALGEGHGGAWRGVLHRQLLLAHPALTEGALVVQPRERGGRAEEHCEGEGPKHRGVIFCRFGKIFSFWTSFLTRIPRNTEIVRFTGVLAFQRVGLRSKCVNKRLNVLRA